MPFEGAEAKGNSQGTYAWFESKGRRVVWVVGWLSRWLRWCDFQGVIVLICNRQTRKKSKILAFRGGRHNRRVRVHQEKQRDVSRTAFSSFSAFS